MNHRRFERVIRDRRDGGHRRIPCCEPLEAKVLLSTVGTSAVPIEVGSASGQSSPEIPTPGTPAATPYGLTPSQVRTAYGFNDISFQDGIIGDGTGQTVAIVVAYEQPNIQSDLAAFDLEYRIAAPPSFNIYSETGAKPAALGNWGIEASLDVEWVHAMAPGANILLVEAASATNSDLYGMVEYAKGQAGVSVVSMSFGTMEVSAETSFDSYFKTPPAHTGVTFVAGSGDSAGGGEYPAASPNVLAVGGTILTTDAAGDYEAETAWPSGGGGISPFEPQPSYQSGITQSNSQRATPDVAFNAGAPASIYDSYDFGTNTPWSSESGTSLATPNWSALVAIADQGKTLLGQGTLDGPSQTLPDLYKLEKTSTTFRDITTGSNGSPAGVGYDLATGLGTPIAEAVAEGLSANIGIPSPVAPVSIPNASLTTITSANPKFAWSPVPGASSYDLIVTNSTSNAIVLDPTGLTTTSYTPTNSPFVVGQDYTWRVQAVSASGSTGDLTDPITFTLPPANTPVILNPTAYGSTTPLISWSVVPGATSYNVFLEDYYLLSQGDGGSPTTDYFNSSLSTNFFTPSTALNYGYPYGLFVSANFASGNSTSSGPQASGEFTIDHVGATTQLSPTEGSSVVTPTPTLQWSAVPNASAYNVTVTDSANPTAYNITTRVLGTSFLPDPVLTLGETYTWTVTPVDASGDLGPTSPSETFLVTASAGPIGNLTAPQLVSPATETKVTTTTPTFLWNSVKGATGYLLVYSTAAETVTTVYQSGQTTAPTQSKIATTAIDVIGTSYTPTTPLLYGAYYNWEVIAVDGAGDVRPAINEVQFLVPPLQASPTDQQSVGSYIPTFQWTSVPGNVAYELKVVDTTTNQPVLDDFLSQTSYTPQFPFEQGRTYTWSVVSVTSTVTITGTHNPSVLVTNTISPEADTSFTIEAPSGGTSALAAPSASTPYGVSTSSTPQFQWSAVPGATGYALYFKDFDTSNSSLVPIVVTTNSYTSTGLASGTYIWWVVAFDTQGDVSPRSGALGFVVQTQPNTGLSQPSGLTPGGILTSTVATLQWSPVSGASAYALTLIDLTLRELILETTVTGGTDYPNQVVNNGDTYEWFVGAEVGQNGVEGPINSQTFTVNSASLGVPNPVAPGNDATLDSLTPLLSWTPVASATFYTVFLFDETTNTSPDPSGSIVTGPSYTPNPPLINEHRYRWMVEANALQNGSTVAGPPSAESEFNVVYPGTPNLNPYQGPVLTTTPVFGWSVTNGAAYYLITIIDMTTMTTSYNAAKVTTNSFIPPTPLVSGDTYEYFVQAFDSAGDAGIVSQSIISNPTSDTGTPVLHAYAGALTGVTPTLTWTAATSAAAYKVFLSDSTRGTMTIYSVTNALTSFTFATPLNGGDTYMWFVWAVDSSGQNEKESITTDTFKPINPPTAIEDIDGDGKADIAVFGKDPKSNMYDERILTSSTAFKTTVVFNNNGYGYGNALSIPIVGDFFGEGRDSYALWTPNVFGGMTFTAVSPEPGHPSIIENFGNANYDPVAADIDGDGIDDFGVYGYFPGLGYAFDFLLSKDAFNPNQQYFFNNYNDSSNGVVYGYGNAQSIPVVADFDSSGKASLGLYTASNSGSNFAVFDPATSSGFVKSISPTMGTAADIPTAIENDPDGEADLSLYGPDPTHPGQYRFLILTASSGFNPGQAVFFNNNGYGFGNGSSVPVMADYSEIGTADYAVFTADGQGGQEFVFLDSQTGGGIFEDFATLTDIALTEPSYLIAKKVRGQ